MILPTLCCLLGSAVPLNDSVSESEIKKHGVVCTPCLDNVEANNTYDEVKYTRLLTEMSKILGHLRMERPPNITVRPSDVPQLVVQHFLDHAVNPGKPLLVTSMTPDSVIGNQDGLEGGEIEELYLFAKPLNSALFPFLSSQCSENVTEASQSACVDIQPNPNLFSKDTVRAEFNVHVPALQSGGILMLTIKELKCDEHNQKGPATVIYTKRVEVDSQANAVDISPGHWISFDITDLVERWKDNPSARIHKHLQVLCDGCLDIVAWSNSLTGATKPYIHVTIAKKKMNKKISRRRRHDDLCRSNLYDHCCLKRYYVNFTDIGWDRWIIQPPGYFANYCTGNCRAVIKPPEVPKRAQAVVNENNGHAVDPQFIPCCAPTRMAPLDMLYAVKAGDIRKQTLPNMIVENCGC